MATVGGVFIAVLAVQGVSGSLWLNPLFLIGLGLACMGLIAVGVGAVLEIAAYRARRRSEPKPGRDRLRRYFEDRNRKAQRPWNRLRRWLRRRGAGAPPEPPVPPVVEDEPHYRATHELRPHEGRVRLVLVSTEEPPAVPTRGSCAVSLLGPEPKDAAAAPFSRAEVTSRSLSLYYPDDFDNASKPPAAGRYEATWGRHWITNPKKPNEIAYREVAARDEFEIPDAWFEPGKEPVQQTPPEHQEPQPGPIAPPDLAAVAHKQQEERRARRSLGWSFQHLALPPLLGGPTVWLEAYGPDDDRRSNVWCLVRAPDGTTTETDLTKLFLGMPTTPNQVEARFRYPQDFPGGSDAAYLADGRYEVEWRASQDVGRQLVGTDCFLIEEGEVQDCDGTTAERVTDLE